MMNRRGALACLMVLCGLLSLFIFAGDNIYMELVFSQESGFYESPFDLELYAPWGADIFYTLDGSKPDENSIKYTEPIHIGDATENNNTYSMRTDMSSTFTHVPDYHIDKCTIVRAVYLDMDGELSEAKTGSYFVGYEGKMGYDEINVISIVTEPDNLFDYDNGIYVLGHTYDDYINDLQSDVFANYFQKGIEWERTADMQYFDTEKKLALTQKCGVRIQGKASREYVPKGIKLYARELYERSGRFYTDFFGTGYMADTITLMAGGQDFKLKIRDYITAELVRNRNFATMHFEPCVLFLNGEYWGVYWLTEKYDDIYLEHYYNVDKDNVIMIKNRELAEGEEIYFYDVMMQYMFNEDLSIAENYQFICDVVDMQSLIDYYAVQIYIGRYIDWPGGNNEALWRTLETEEGNVCADGKWRWMLFDSNTGGLSADITDMDTLKNAMGYKMFYNLCQNEDFKEQFVVTFMDIANTCFTEENVDTVISKYLELMTEPLKIHMRRFFGVEDNSQFYEDVANVKAFLYHRKPYIVQYLKDDLGLLGTPALVNIEINDCNAGSVTVNTARITWDDQNKWSGEYYTDYPITITAAANDGYRFLGWEGDIYSGEEYIKTEIGGGISLKAIFEKVNQ